MEADYAITEGQANIIDPETDNSLCTLKLDMDTAENDTKCTEGPKANDGQQCVTTQNKTLKFSIFNILGLSSEEATESTTECKYVDVVTFRMTLKRGGCHYSWCKLTFLLKQPEANISPVINVKHFFLLLLYLFPGSIKSNRTYF